MKLLQQIYCDLLPEIVQVIARLRDVSISACDGRHGTLCKNNEVEVPLPKSD